MYISQHRVNNVDTVVLLQVFLSSCGRLPGVDKLKVQLLCILWHGCNANEQRWVFNRCIIVVYNIMIDDLNYDEDLNELTT